MCEFDVVVGVHVRCKRKLPPCSVFTVFPAKGFIVAVKEVASVCAIG